MKISEQALREWVNPEIDTQTLAEQLTLLGLEVDSIEAASGEFTDVVVGLVHQVSKHPNADRLRVCEVEVGEGELLTIVCGATNVRANLKVAVAQVGALLPGNFKIKPAKLRGVASCGMICSSQELGLSESSEGILELPANAPVGALVFDYFKLDDHIIDIDLTPNRGDCLSLQGVAREVAARNQCTLKPLTFQAPKADIADQLNVNISAPQACPRYVGRIIRGINPKISSPLWLQEQLRRAGLRSVNLLVDVGNWVMLELGQPLHLFDLNKLSGGLTIRFAKAGEQVKLLNEAAVMLNEKTLCVCDEKGVQAIAGVMGAMMSAVCDTTTDVFIESAFFDPLVISGVARRFGLSSESAYRFERGVDPTGQQRALERASQLIIDVARGQAGPIITVESAQFLPQASTIELPRSEIKRLLGIKIDDDEVVNIFNNLAMNVTVTSNSFKVVPPAFRFDIKLAADLIEELIRLHGLDRLPAVEPLVAASASEDRLSEVKPPRIQDLLVDRDYREVINYSFIDPEVQSLLFPQIQACRLANPLSQDLSVMRVSLWPGLLQAVKYNQHRQQGRIRLFETGLCFQADQGGIDQVERIAGVITGAVTHESWSEKTRQVDFFDVKGDVEALLALGNKADYCFVAQPHCTLHPGQSAQLRRGEQPVGWLGMLHPQHTQQLGLSGPIFLFECDLEYLKTGRVAQFKTISKFPAVRRDIAIVVDKTVTLAEIIAKITHSGGALLQKVQVFDIYQGEGIDSMKKSVALALNLQDNSRTLTDEDINKALTLIINELAQTFAATLRK